MRIYSIKPRFQKFLEPVMRIFIKLEIGPTAINVSALAISIIAGIFIYLSSINYLLLLTVPIFAFVRTALNALDGMVARKTKAKNQKFGEVLNEFLDRLSDTAFFLGATFVSYVNTVLGLGTLVAILLVSYIGIVGKAAGGKRQYVGLMGKADRMFWLSVGCVAAVIFNRTEIMNLTLGFILAFSLVTILIRFSAIKKELYR